MKRIDKSIMTGHLNQQHNFYLYEKFMRYIIGMHLSIDPGGRWSSSTEMIYLKKTL